jgi:hypothetical protein
MRDLFGTVLIPESVRQEFLATERIARKQGLENSPWIQTETLEHPHRALAFAGLDRGEAEVLALAEEREARLVVMDERRGRAYARRLGLPLTGTIGVLLLGKERGFVDAVKPLLDVLQEAGLYLSSELIEEAIHIAGES